MASTDNRMSMQASAHAVTMIVTILVMLGLLMIYSTRAPALARVAGFDASWQPLLDQGYKVAAGILFFMAGLFLRPALLVRHHKVILIAAVGLLGLVLVPGPSAVINGARRWIVAGGVAFQPMEFAKIGLVLYLAARVSLLGTEIRSFIRGFLPQAAVMGLLAGLLLLQPDFGSAVFFLGLGSLILIFGGARMSHFLLIGLVVLPVCVGYAVKSLEHVSRRISQFMEPTAGDQALQSMLALGAGGVGGADVGAGTMKLGYLPMVDSDFILAAIGEEFGFIGTSLVVLLFLLFTMLGARIVLAQRSRASFLMGAGILISISTQAIINIAVVTGAVPTKGIALPFVSAGGSSLAASLFGVGLLVGMALRSSEAEEREPNVRTVGSVGAERIRAAKTMDGVPLGGAHG